MSSKSVLDLRDTSALRRNRIIETTSITSPIKLHDNVMRGCKACGLSKPNKVQLHVLPHFAEFSFPDLLINASPRSGKTSSAVIGILDNFSRAMSKYSLAIIVCPTYEIAEISYSCCQILGKYCDISFYFTAKGKRQNKDARPQKEIVIGPPDRILDLSRASLLDLKKASFLVIDEADCLSNPRKFFCDISQIFQRLSPKCRSILCTVTKNKAIDDFVAKHMNSPVEISVTDGIHRPFPTKQIYLVCADEREKMESLAFLVNMQAFRGKVVVFTEAKETANELGIFLQKKDVLSVLLIGDLSIPRRKKALEDFKTGSVLTLITTRSFVSIIPASCSTKLIHYDQILDERDRLDLNVYNRRDYLLSAKEENLIVYYIEKRWEEFLFEDKDVSKGRSFFNNVEILNSLKLDEYFT